ncbi:MAG: hypothetical protein DRP83_05580 [Planctomycetota bacterium]|nr:MAG: hypothetical protein DRP83_05580 [Planctomycetota bacterium]
MITPDFSQASRFFRKVNHNNRPIETLRKELRHTFTFGDIVSKSDQILRILDIPPNVADSDSPVLATGPSGTGKELLVRAIHNASPRRSWPFVVYDAAKFLALKGRYISLACSGWSKIFSNSMLRPFRAAR